MIVSISPIWKRAFDNVRLESVVVEKSFQRQLAATMFLPRQDTGIQLMCRNSPIQKNKRCHVAVCRLSGSSQHPLCLTLLWCHLRFPCSIQGLRLWTSRGWWVLNHFSHLHILFLGSSIWCCHVGEHVVLSFTFIFSRLQLIKSKKVNWIVGPWMVGLDSSRLWMCELYVCVNPGCVGLCLYRPRMHRLCLCRHWMCGSMFV